MIEGILAIVVAVGLVLAIVGSWHAKNATLVCGVEENGYGTVEGLDAIEKLIALHRKAWCPIVAGFALQFCRCPRLRLAGILASRSNIAQS